MGFPTFLSDLFEHGRVLVPNFGPSSPEETAAGDAVLAAFEGEYRKELPGDPPDWSAAAAGWAATSLYHACQFVVFRDVDADRVNRALRVPCPQPRSPSVHYSVDLTFRFLPDLLRLARTAARRDPLVDRLLDWAAQWPISSVGVADVGPMEIETFIDHPCMRGLYVDRIIARKDTSRLADGRVREAVQQVLGLFGELAPEMALAIEGHGPEEVT